MKAVVYTDPTRADFDLLYDRGQYVRGFILPDTTLHIWDGNLAYHDDILERRPEFQAGLRVRWVEGMLEIDWLTAAAGFPKLTGDDAITAWVEALPAVRTVSVGRDWTPDVEIDPKYAVEG